MLAAAGMVDEVDGWLQSNGVRLRAITPQRATLEELFMAAAHEAPPVPGVRSA